MRTLSTRSAGPRTVMPGVSPWTYSTSAARSTIRVSPPAQARVRVTSAAWVPSWRTMVRSPPSPWPGKVQFQPMGGHVASADGDAAGERGQGQDEGGPGDDEKGANHAGSPEVEAAR